MGSLESPSESADEDVRRLNKKKFKHVDDSVNDEENSDIEGSRIVVNKDYGFDEPSDTMSDS